MEVQTLWMTDFRNYEAAEVEFGSQLNLVTGRNGQGKTNLLEAINLLSTLGSHRTSANAPLVRHGQDRAVVRAKATARGRQVSLDAEVQAYGGVRLLVNKVALERARDSAGVFSAVLFSPEDLALVKGGPSERRRFLDHAAARLRPLAAAERQEFERVLKQRNGVLKAARANPRALRSLEEWDGQLARTGAAVVRNRLEALSRIEPASTARYRQVSGSAVSPQLQYRPSWAEGPLATDVKALEAALCDAIAASRPADIERAITLAGPHRDDLAVELDGGDARSFASQGEQRSLALCLRLGERDAVADEAGEDPVLLLDDVFSELDDDRRAQLADLVRAGGQTIATATGNAPVPFEGARRIKVSNGKVSGE